MRLYEFEGKELLKKYDVPVPDGRVVTKVVDVPSPCVVKAQVLFGKRADFGGICIAKSVDEARDAMSQLLNAELKGETVEKLLVESFVNMDEEYYVGFLFDTDVRAPVLLFSKSGGTGIEERGEVGKLVVNPIVGLSENVVLSFLEAQGADPGMASVLVSLYEVFVREDCRLLEINPLAMTKDGVVCVDARVELDDFALKRHKERDFEARPASLGRPLTEREKIVKETSEADHRGTIKYLELDGDIAVLAAGGGGSLTCMDALIKAGGRPSNYTEFSGNPSDEKMYVLTKQAITKTGIKGCWIVGAIANFSRVDTMMAGIVKAFEEVKPGFPIVVRRAGPFEKEGLALLRDAAEKHGWNVEVFGAETPLTATAKAIVERAYDNSA